MKLRFVNWYSCEYWHFFELRTSYIEIKVMAEANVNIADEFEIGEEEMAVFLLH